MAHAPVTLSEQIQFVSGVGHEESTSSSSSTSTSSMDEETTDLFFPYERPAVVRPMRTSPRPLSNEHFWIDRRAGMPNWKAISHHLYRAGKIEKRHVLEVLQLTSEALGREPNVCQLHSPVLAFGNLRGQFYELLRMFHQLEKDVHESGILFLGGYVPASISTPQAQGLNLFGFETIFLLCCFKLYHRSHPVVLLRSAHETRQFAEVYGNLKKEIEFKYDTEVYEAIISLFKKLPIAAVVDNQYFCVQSGIPKTVSSIEEINRLNRFVEDIPEDSVLAEILCWEPLPDFELYPEVRYSDENKEEGELPCYGLAGVRQFFAKNNLKLLIRGKDLLLKGHGKHLLGEKILILTLSSSVQDMSEEDPSIVHTQGKVVTQAAVALITGSQAECEDGGLLIKQWRHSRPPPFLVPNFLYSSMIEAKRQWEERNRGRAKHRHEYLQPSDEDSDETGDSEESWDATTISRDILGMSPRSFPSDPDLRASWRQAREGRQNATLGKTRSSEF